MAHTPVKQLREMAHAWGWTPKSTKKPTKADLTAGLSDMLKDPVHLWHYLMNLPKPAKGLLWTILSSGGSIIYDQQKPTDAPTHVPLSQLSKLTDYGLTTIYPDDTTPKGWELVIVPREIYLQFRLPSAYSDSLGEWLSLIPLEKHEDPHLPSVALWQIAKRNRIDVRHTFVVLKELIRHKILDIQYLRNIYREQLSTSEQQLLKILSIKQRALGLEELRREWLHFRWSVDILDMVDILESLQERGLLFLSGPNGEVSGRRVTIPNDLAMIIRNNFVKEYRSPSVRKRTFFTEATHPVEQESQSPFQISDDVTALLSYLFSEDVSLLGNDPKDLMSGRVHRKHWRRISPNLTYKSVDVIEYLNFLFHFCRFEGLLAKQGDRLIAVSEKVHLIRDHLRLAARMLSYWLHFVDKDGKLIKEHPHSHKNVLPLPINRLSPSWQTRQILLANLATLPVNRMINLDDYLDTFLEQEITLFAIDNVPISKLTRDQIRDDILNSLSGPLNWINVIDLIINLHSETTQFRVSSFGMKLLRARKRDTEKAAPSPENQFLVLANLEIILPPDLDPAVRFRLCQIVELRGNHSVITKDSIRRAMDNDWTAKSIKDLLMSNSRSKVPENVITFIEDIAQRHGHIIINAGERIVETRDPWLMTEIRARRTIKPYVSEPESENTARIPKGKDPRRLLILLRKSGYLPKWIS